MKYVSALALLAALSVCAPAYAQSTKASASNTTSVTVSAGGTSVSAGANTGVSASAGTSGSSTSASAGGGTSASASASAGDTGSSAPSAASSAAAPENCSNGGQVQTSAIDTATLAMVTTVNVELVSNCSGLPQLDSGAAAALSANSKVAAAVQAAGGAEVIGYDLNGTTLTVYAKK